MGELTPAQALEQAQNAQLRLVTLAGRRAAAAKARAAAAADKLDDELRVAVQVLGCSGRAAAKAAGVSEAGLRVRLERQRSRGSSAQS